MHEDSAAATDPRYGGVYLKIWVENGGGCGKGQIDGARGTGVASRGWESREDIEGVRKI